MQVCRGSFGGMGRISGDAWMIGGRRLDDWIEEPRSADSSRVACLKKRDAAGIMLRQRVERFYP
jgi:hypothetical protein